MEHFLYEDFLRRQSNNVVYDKSVIPNTDLEVAGAILTGGILATIFIGAILYYYNGLDERS